MVLLVTDGLDGIEGYAAIQQTKMNLRIHVYQGAGNSLRLLVITMCPDSRLMELFDLIYYIYVSNSLIHTKLYIIHTTQIPNHTIYNYLWYD